MILPIGRREVDRFREIVAARLGLSFPEERLDDVAAALRNRSDRVTAGMAAAYVDLVATEAGWLAEASALVELLTVSETYFFRYADHFRALAEAVFPEIARERRHDRPLRILSAGCSSGEEPHSIAILALEHAAALGGARAEVVGIDVNAASLEKAARGRYSDWSFRETPSSVRERHFTRSGRDHVLRDEARRAVSFELRNLVDDDPAFWREGAFDVVFCRNVTMYFSADAAKRVVARFARVLEPSGFLLLGHAETLRGVSNEFHLCHTHETFYYRRRGAGRAGRALRSGEPGTAPARTTVALGSGWMEPIERFAASIQSASERIAKLSRECRDDAEPGAPSDAPSAPRGAPAGTWERDVAIDLFRRERFGEAVEILRTLSPASAADPDALLVQAIALANTGEIAAAEGACRRLLEIDCLNAGAHYVLALCREHAGDGSGVLEHDVTAIYLDPGFAMPHLHLGLAARRWGDAETARRELRQAMGLLPSEDAARILLFGGGFTREALVRACRTELAALSGPA